MNTVTVFKEIHEKLQFRTKLRFQPQSWTPFVSANSIIHFLASISPNKGQIVMLVLVTQSAIVDSLVSTWAESGAGGSVSKLERWIQPPFSRGCDDERVSLSFVDEVRTMYSLLAMYRGLNAWQ